MNRRQRRALDTIVDRDKKAIAKDPLKQRLIDQIAKLRQQRAAAYTAGQRAMQERAITALEEKHSYDDRRAGVEVLESIPIEPWSAVERQSGVEIARDGESVTVAY